MSEDTGWFIVIISVMATLCVGTLYLIMSDPETEDSTYFDSLDCDGQKEFLKSQNFTFGFQKTYILNCLEIRD